MSSTVAASYPLTIPAPFVDYSGASQNATLVGGLENGAISRNKRFQTSYSQLAARWVFTNTEHETFRSFFTDTLHNGVSLFQIQLRFPYNAQLTTWVARFVGELRSEYKDGNWIVEAGLSLLRTA